MIGHADWVRPPRDYCIGLLMPCDRKSLESMAAVTAPERTAAQHQSLLHFVGEGRSSDERVLAKVRETVLPVIMRWGKIQAWIIDDTGFPKKGGLPVGCRANIAGNRASRTIARSRSRFRPPIPMPAYCGLPPLSAGAVGIGRGAPCEGWRAGGDRASDHDRHRMRSDSRRLRGRPAACPVLMDAGY